MSDFIIKHNVPILDEHEIKDDEGRVIARVDARKLALIAERANRRVSDTGDEVPIIIGHTKDDLEETQQPEIVGYARNFSVRRLLNTARKAVCATFKFFKNKAHKAAQFPRRSVELWLSDWKIDPIALLGATTPERDLGLLKLSRTGAKVYRRILPLKYEKENSEPMDEKKIVAAVLAALKETAPFKFLEQLMQESQAGQDGQGDGLPQEAGHDGMDGEGLDGMDGLEGDGQDGDGAVDAGNLDGEDGEEPARYSAGFGSGTSTFTPGSGMGRSRPRMKCRKPGQPRRLSRDDASILLSRYERGYEKLANAYNDLRIRFQKSEREKDLIQLEAEGVMLDRTEELETIGDLPEDRYQAHLDKIRRRYSKAPIGNPSWSPAEDGRPSTGRQGGLNREEMQKVAAYATQRKIPFQQALDEFNGTL